jgi:hypothetical protein
VFPSAARTVGNRQPAGQGTVVPIGVIMFLALRRSAWLCRIRVAP